MSYLPDKPPREWTRPNATAALCAIAALAILVITIGGGAVIFAKVWEALG